MQTKNEYELEANADDLHHFVVKHASLIKKIAYHLKCRLPKNTDMNDLIQSGLIGLLEARQHFSSEGGASFETYASRRIRGAMIDEFRKNTGITRDISQNISNISKARAQLENTQQQVAISSVDIAHIMGISATRYAHINAEISVYHSISHNEVENLEAIACEDTPDPLSLTEAAELQAMIKTVINTLPKREQQILALYYNEQLNFKEIGEILELTEARISQLHSSILLTIRKKYACVE